MGNYRKLFSFSKVDQNRIIEMREFQLRVSFRSERQLCRQLRNVTV